MGILNTLMGRGKCIVTVGPHPMTPGMAVVYIVVPKNWFAAKTYVVDLITFLLFTEKLVECTDYGKPFTFKIDGEVAEYEGAKSSKDITIDTHAIKAAQIECGKAGPEVYTLMKKLDEMFDKATEKALQSPDFTEEAKKRLRERESMLSVYKRQHAKMMGYDPMVLVSGTDAVN